MTSARTAFVTGGSRGIGRACALALAEAGHRVAFCYSSDQDGAKETQAAIEGAGGEALAIQASVADAQAVDRAFGEIEDAFGPVEILVNNAGITADGLVMRMTDEQWDSVLEHEPHRRVPHHPAGHPEDDAGAVRPDRERVLGERPDRPAGSGELRRRQSGPGRPHAVGRPGARFPRASPAISSPLDLS